MKKITPSQKRRLERRKQLRMIKRPKACIRFSHKRLLNQLCILAWLKSIDFYSETWFLFVEGGI